jgi:hypothetical protein
MLKKGAGTLVVLLLLHGGALAAPRDVMIRSIDTVSLILELHNFGPGDESLSGYRFCSQDNDQIRVYSLSSGLNGVTIQSGTSLFFHFLNDAPADPDHINISSVGLVAVPLDNGPYAISLYFPPVVFANGDTMADHIQWSIGGVDDASADERSDEAEAGGLWTDQSLWVSTAVDTVLIRLNAGAESTVLHGPGDYTSSGAPSGAGEVPDGDGVPGVPLTVALSGGMITLNWDPSCNPGDSDYEVYEGTLGIFTSHAGIVCSTGGLTSSTFVAPGGDAYYLVVPGNASSQGSYGVDSLGAQRPASLSACNPQSLVTCP